MNSHSERDEQLFSVTVRDDDPRARMAEFGDLGFMEFEVDEAAGLMHVYALIWLG